MHIKFNEALQNIIARRAHELSTFDSSEQGDNVSAWLMAEKEIMNELDDRTEDLYNVRNCSSH